MPLPFRLISQYFWLICLGVTWLNDRRANARLASMGGLSNASRQEATTCIRWFSVLSSLPWLVVGLGQILGATPTVWDYFRPQDGNPFVLSWLALIVLLAYSISGWILFGGGARKVVDLKLVEAFGRHRFVPPTVLAVKCYAVLSMAIAPVWIWGVQRMDAPLSKAASPAIRPNLDNGGHATAYRTVFDIATAGYKSWSFPAFGLIFVAIGVLLVVNRRNLPGTWSRRPRSSSAFAFFFLGFAVLWTVVSFTSTYGEYTSLSRAEKAREGKVVEGKVTNFKPMPATGHAMEKFCVSDTCFEYSDYIVTGGFNNTSSHGGPLREGLQVRVTHVGNDIVKLEVAD